MADQQQLIEDLKGTKVALQEHGRCKGNFMTAEGKVCLVGAISMAVSGCGLPYTMFNYGDDPLFVRYSAAIRELEKVRGHRDIADYNDEESTTDDDIQTLIDKALAGLGALA